MEQSQKGIFFRLKLIYIIIALLGIGILGANLAINLFWLSPFLENLKQNFLDLELAQAERISYIIRTSVKQVIKNSEEIAISIGVTGIETGEAEIILSRFLRDNPEIKTVSVMGLDGREIQKMSVSRFYGPGDMENLFSSGEFLGGIIGETFVSRVIFSENAEPYIVIGVPVFSFDKNEVIGVLRLELSLWRVWDVVLAVVIGRTGRAYVVDNEGNLIADPDSSRVLQGVNLANIPPVEAAIKGNDFYDLESGRYFNEKNKEVIGVGVSMEELRWGVIVEQSTEEILGPIQSLEKFASLFFFGSLAVLIVLAWMARLLSDSSRKMAKNYTQLEAQKNELNSSAGLLLARDVELSKTQKWLKDALVKSDKARVDLDTERKRMEAVIGSLIDCLVVLDADGKISSINPSAEKVFEVKEEWVVFKNSEELFQYPYLKSLFDTIGKHASCKIFCELELALPSPSEKIFEVVIMPFKDEKENILGTVISMHDITREKHVEKMKTEFVSLAAHQLRTPLSAIKWILRTLLDRDVGEITEEQAEILEKGYKSNERMILLINDLLNVARIEEGRFLYNLAYESIEEIIEEVLVEMEHQTEEKKIELVFEKPPAPLPKIRVDAEKIKLALHNLLDNAISYNKEGGRVIIAAKKDNRTNDIEVAVQDTGIGIPLAQQNRLFNKFFRADNALKINTEGSGLGLFIVRNIVAAHGGKIRCESRENEGTIFRFTLPISSSL